MIRLFEGDGEHWSEKANEISRAVLKALKPIIDKAAEEDVCLRELAYVVDTEASLLITSAILGKQVKLSKAGRKESHDSTS